MTLKYNTKSCEYLSLAGTMEAYLFDGMIEYTQKISSHSAFLKTTRSENLTAGQMDGLKEFINELCGTCFANHYLYATTADAQQSLLKGADAFFAINKIHEQLGFLPQDHILLKVLAEECMCFTDANVTFNFVDPENNYYMYFKGGRIEHENNLVLTIKIEQLTKPKKSFFGLF